MNSVSGHCKASRHAHLDSSGLFATSLVNAGPKSKTVARTCTNVNVVDLGCVFLSNVSTNFDNGHPQSRPYLTWAETVVPTPFEDAVNNRERRYKLRNSFEGGIKGRLKLLEMLPCTCVTGWRAPA
jgi:hypothetical protein